MFFIPDTVCGDVLAPTWHKTADGILESLGPDSWPEHKVGNFTYHLFPSGNYPGTARRKFEIFRFYMRRGFSLIRTHRYDAVMAYGWTLTGIAAFILKLAARVKLIIDVGAAAPHSYNKFGRYGTSRRTLALRVSKAVSDLVLYFVAGSADRVVLRDPNALSHYPRLKKVPASVIHGFVAVSQVPFTGRSEDYLLLVGAPWYVKGVDVLIRAFQQIQSEFPNCKLRLLGHYPDRHLLGELIAGNPRIEILTAVPNAQALAIIANCAVFVLASRTETQGRVLLEAMAAGKPVVGSRVDGIPHYIQDGVNGLLFECGNPDDLACKLRLLLASPDLRDKLGRAGYELARTRYNEISFGEQFRAMVALTVGRSGTQVRVVSESRLARGDSA
jgi:glycosyltransferase involved in cell wall biosynthesis